MEARVRGGDAGVDRGLQQNFLDIANLQAMLQSRAHMKAEFFPSSKSSHHCQNEKPALVQVETHGTLTSGMTVTEFSPPAGQNALVGTGIDTDRFWTTVLGAYGTLPVAR